MFREVARKNKRLSREECIDVLKGQLRGVLSLIGDDGYPYGVPMNYFYSEEDHRIFFHSGKAGHKVEAMARCDKASFCVYDQGYRNEGEWALNTRSVIVFGRIRVVEDMDDAMEKCRALSLKFTQDTAYIEQEIQKYGGGTLCFELDIEHMTGKIVNEA